MAGLGWAQPLSLLRGFGGRQPAQGHRIRNEPSVFQNLLSDHLRCVLSVEAALGLSVYLGVLRTLGNEHS